MSKYFLSFYFMNDLHFSITTCGIIVSCHGIGSIAGARFGGKLSDITSPTLVSAISLLLQAIGYLALTILHTPASIMIDAFILGAASYGFITSNHMWTLQHCTNGERLKAINLLSTASNLGFSLSAILMGTIISFGFHHLFIFVSSITLLMSSYLFIRAKSIRKLPTLTESCASNHKHAQHHHCTQPHRQIIIYVMLTCVLMTGITVSQLSSTYPIYVQHQFPSMGVQSFSILFAINSLLVVMLEAPLGSLFVKHNKILILGLGALLIGVGMCLLTISLVFSLAVIACVIYTIGEIIFFCIAQLIAYEYGDNGKKGASIGLYRMTFAASRVIGPTVGAYIYYHVSGEVVWYISGVIGLACFTACYLLSGHSAKRQKMGLTP